MKAENARVAVYGAGAMGTVLGAFLSAGGLKNLTLITRNEKHVVGLNKGARIVCEADGDEQSVQVQACTPMQMTGKYDVVFLMTKQRENQKILQFLLPYLHEESIVCTTQNGLPEQSVANVVGEKRTFFGIASFGANVLGDGAVALTSKREAMRLEIAPMIEDNDEKTQLLLNVLSYAGRAVGNTNFATQTQNPLGARWSKLAINSAFSGLSVVTGLTFGEIAKKRKTKKIALGILKETFSVANANGITLNKMQGKDMQKWLGGDGFFKEKLALALLPVAMKKHKKLTSGMLKDVLAGKKCEIDYICGVVVEFGRRVGVETPLCEKVVEIVHGIENGLYEISIENTDFLR